MNYGQLFAEYTPVKDFIYESFANYFDNPIMNKHKDVDKYSMYICKIYCLLNKDSRYIIVFTTKDDNIQNFQIKLKDIRWLSFQTRTLTESYHHLKKHDYKPKQSHPYNIQINAIKKDETQITYHTPKDTELNLTIVLLIPEKGSHFYQDKGTLAAAFETYNTIISIN